VCDFNCKFLQEEYKDIFPNVSYKIHKHHLGLDLQEFCYVNDGRAINQILAVGALEKYKGFEYLLRAGEVLSGAGLDYEIIFIGDGKETASLKTLASKLHIENRVKFLGWLPSDAVRIAMTRATILVHPSDGLGDAVPTVIKEAMASGTPVVASNIAGIPELLDYGRCGMLVPPKNPGALAESIQILLCNDELRRRYAKKARVHAEEKFDLWRNGERLAALLNSSSARGSSRAV
jgi:glycosyltransferase involved in cell wall biosynthesis